MNADGGTVRLADVNPYVSLGGQKDASSVFASLKILVRNEPFMTFAECGMGAKCNNQIVDQRAENCRA